MFRHFSQRKKQQCGVRSILVQRFLVNGPLARLDIRVMLFIVLMLCCRGVGGLQWKGGEGNKINCGLSNWWGAMPINPLPHQKLLLCTANHDDVVPHNIGCVAAATTINVPFRSGCAVSVPLPPREPNCIGIMSMRSLCKFNQISSIPPPLWHTQAGHCVGANHKHQHDHHHPPPRGLWHQ